MRLPLTLTLIPALIVAGLAFASPAAAAPSGQATLAQLLDDLTVASNTTATYDRAYFEHWVDADHNGCDTRAEVLVQESLVPVVFGSGCTIATGQWTSWYDGATWTNASDVDIDHMVPLAEAWRSGASAWNADQRRAYANDLDLNVALEAVTDNVNQSKSDRDPASWLPPAQPTHCQYATDWVLVKYRWGLTIDVAERNALTAVISGPCAATIVAIPQVANTGPAPTIGVQRIAGADRYGTAVAISSRYPAGTGVVYVATGMNYPDALSAAPAAVAQGGPLLLTASTTLPQAVSDEIKRLAPPLIVVVGGTAAVSSPVFKLLSTLAPSIRRDSGVDRYETSRIVNIRAFAAHTTTTAYFATGNDFPDALSASAAAGSRTSPVILLNGGASGVDDATRSLLAALGVNTGIIAGGTAVISAQVASALGGVVGSLTRLAGTDRYSTSRIINSGTFSSAPTAYFAVGNGFADALAGAALAGRDHAPLYVVPDTCVPKEVIADLQGFGTTGRVLLGGTSALGLGVENFTPCPTAPPPPAPPAPPANPGDAVNCDDFGTWRDAQNWFETYQAYGDIADLDRDNDGIACESLPGHP